LVTPPRRHPNGTGSLARHDERALGVPRTRIHQPSDITRRKHLACADRHGSDQPTGTLLAEPGYPVCVAVPTRTSKLVPVAVAIFALGLVALAAVFVLFVSGHHDLPLWLNGSAGVLVPLGLALALFGLVREARASAGRR
jgi:hypothetical protein